MFWFVFVPIVLFIIFLIALLISSRSQGGMRPSRPEESKKRKNRAARKIKAETTPQTVSRNKKTEAAIAAAALVNDEHRVTSYEKPVVQPEPHVAEETAVSCDVPFIEEEPFVEEETVQEPPAVFRDTTDDADRPLAEERAAGYDEPSAAVEEISKHDVDGGYVEVEKGYKPTPEREIGEVEEEAIAEVSPSATEVMASQAVPEADDYGYAPFDHTRTMEEFGLSREDADDFIVELIQQIEAEMPALETAVETKDNKRIEDISHMIKGSATNLGTGGAADVLIDFNTYMKTGDEPAVIARHMRHLNRALGELKEQFQS
jgi:hypothetical protein